MDRTKVAAIVGPTAVGKTDVSLDVARALDAEIVSVDSMQVYRGMDAGTAKPGPHARAAVVHHLIDVAEPTHDVTVAEFQRAGRRAVEEIAARGKLPLLVGGSGLYFRALVDDLELPPRSEAVRAALEKEAQSVGPEGLYERLRALDPGAAARIEPGNARRIVRALEVIEVTGRPFSDNRSWDDYSSIYELAIVGLERARADLVARIDSRVNEMLERGLVEEARRLEERGMSRAARQALGYRQVLDAGPDASRDELRAAIVKATARYARRQMSWWRSDPRIAWHDAGSDDLATGLVAYFREALRLP
ncbi:MAG TPA: tRNA (adenosine(37)-N6)-dimethylallyltransferase MiaA [Actinomycetota bacterium]|jgi:tRNA dimethylallyltransferase